jgi:CheY-like chemotaxis protein
MPVDPGPRAALAGRRVLIVEDQFLVAMNLELMLEELGCTVILRGNARFELDSIGEPVDVAILDINLGDHTSYNLADTLIRAGVPFAFASGYGSSEPRFAAVPILGKPYTKDSLVAVLNALLAAP